MNKEQIEKLDQIFKLINQIGTPTIKTESLTYTKIENLKDWALMLLLEAV